MNPRREKPLKPDQDIPTSSSIVPIHLLLVEDNPGDVRLVHEMLRDQAHIKLEVADGLAACLGRLAQGGIDLVLLDLGLRDSQGLNTLTSVTQAHPEMPVVVLTGLDDDAMALRAVQAGGQDYLTKNTITPEILRRTIRHAIERKQVESQKNAALEALQRSEENFRLSLEDSPLGVRIATAKSETIYANKVFLDLYGYESIDEFNGIPIKERYTPQSYAEFRIRKKARDHSDFGPGVYEINIVRKNKEIRHLQVLRKEVLWNGIKKFQVIYQDITERKRAESQREAAVEALRVNEKKLNEAQVLGQIGNWEYDIKNQKITWSKEVYKLYERDPVLGPPTAEEEAVYYSPEQGQTLRGYKQNAIETGQFFEYDLQATLPSGKQVYLTARLRPIKDAQGHVIKLFGTVQDITERKQTEAALTKSEEKFRKIFYTSPDSMNITHLENGLYISINPGFTRTTGYTEEDIIGKNAIEAKIWDNIEDRQKLVDGLKKDGEVTNLGVAFRTKGNNLRYGLISASIIDLSGVPYILSIIRDITERKQAEEKIRNSLVEKEVLLKEVHHRVKNNLMIIIGLIKMQEAKADNEMFNPLMQELEGRIRSMALVHEGLYKSADLAHVNLQNYIEMMSGQIHAQFGAERDIRFSVQAAGVDVNLDSAVPCGLILNELLTNAFKHGFPDNRPGSGAGNCEINVIVNQAGGMNVLTVADNGVGLPADLDWEKSEALGLRLIKMLSKQINSSIELDRSTGTVFRLKFPIAV